MIRKIDELGRVLIPADMRNSLRLEKEDDVHVECLGNEIVLSKAKPCCVICRSAGPGLEIVKQTPVCTDCVEKMKAM